jgi:hypothetical protein
VIGEIAFPAHTITPYHAYLGMHDTPARTYIKAPTACQPLQEFQPTQSTSSSSELSLLSRRGQGLLGREALVKNKQAQQLKIQFYSFYCRVFVTTSFPPCITMGLSMQHPWAFAFGLLGMSTRIVIFIYSISLSFVLDNTASLYICDSKNFSKHFFKSVATYDIYRCHVRSGSCTSLC